MFIRAQNDIVGNWELPQLMYDLLHTLVNDSKAANLSSLESNSIRKKILEENNGARRPQSDQA